MNRKAIHDAIRTRFNIEIETGQNIPIGYDNLPFTAPNQTKHMFLRIRPSFGTLEEIGQVKRHRIKGVILIQVRVPLEKGDKEALEILDFIDVAFRSRAIGGITYHQVNQGVAGEMNGWYQTNASIAFHADDIV